jgi:hypothetical protein
MQVAEAAGASWAQLHELSRYEAAALIAEGGKRILTERVSKGEIEGCRLAMLFRFSAVTAQYRQSRWTI